ncbi:glycosyl hydrolase family 95 catalytic domain-containing protein [Crossiella cryophila]|uniref:Glycosyl hydrolase family 95 catalytic domain-containing protein n=1 Tax=Crossiella cryophila TaxID=43355 RepID=A0A7W7C7J3_9PSEU|nr:Tat pathway signal sequence domain protein [Crossiella cryophila]MBB4675926.1 hypothetical protein [Crossiella cryophila]
MDSAGELTRRGLLGGALAGVAGAVAAPAALAGAEDPAAPVEAVGSGSAGGGWVDGPGDRGWTDFLATSDLIWRRLPATWAEGPFLGNGFLGSGIYAPAGGNSIRFNVQHSEVQDHRPEFGALFGLARIPIGHLALTPVGAITGVDWRLDLHNAELRGTITTAAGTIGLRAIVHSGRSVLAVELTPSAGEHGLTWKFHPATAISPRTDPRFNKPPPPGFRPNPAPELEQHGDTHLAAQPLLAGGGHVTAWRETTRGDRRTLYATVAWAHPGALPRAKALHTVRAAAAQSLDTFARGHRRWWNDYYRKSFLSVPDGRLQSFYWIQLYKIASAARADAPVMATTGPWLEPTPWPATWWNLNVQLEYWLIHGSNHLELDAVTRSLDRHRDALRDQVDAAYRDGSYGVPRTTDMFLRNGSGTGTAGYGIGIPGKAEPTPEVGNLVWALHNVWLSYRHTMDEHLLREVLFPLLRGAIRYYLHFLGTGPDGRLHLPFTFSPEYGVNAPDCTYDLALLRWGCKTLLDAAKILRVADPMTGRWREVLDKLTGYPVDANGYMIGAGAPFAKSHRHYSHLLQVYPLYEITWEQPEHRKLIETSLEHWISFEGALQGYSFTGAASISAQMGRGDKAEFYLGELLRRFVKPNTMYQESGPVIETPLSAAQSLHDMLCQSWGGVIRVFPAVPASWREAVLHEFRTEGAFLLSAKRSGGATQWVRLRSEAGAPCVLRPGIEGQLSVRDRWGLPRRWKDLGEGRIELFLRAGEEVLVHRKGVRPDLRIGPVTPNTPAAPWGLPA